MYIYVFDICLQMAASWCLQSWGYSEWKVRQ